MTNVLDRSSILRHARFSIALFLGAVFALDGALSGVAQSRAVGSGAVASPSHRAGSLSPRSAFLVRGEGAETRHLRWYKGNTHTHTINADGDSTPDEVVKWYREHNGFHFVAITDHNYLAVVGALNALFGAEGKFLVMSGEEISDRFQKKYVHLNGLDLREVVPPQGGASVADVLQRNADAIRKAGGVPVVNHPNFVWSIAAGDLKQLRGVRLLEIYSSNPDVANFGGGGKPSVEEIWDDLLTSGQEVYGTAADDAHEFKKPWNADVKRPGLAWVTVRSAALDAKALVAAMERGEFYASTGVELDDISVTPQRMTISVTGKNWIGRVQFIGKNGKVLKEVVQNPAAYEFTGDEGYVRARVIDGNGRIAWVQPTFLGSQPSQ